MATYGVKGLALLNYCNLSHWIDPSCRFIFRSVTVKQGLVQQGFVSVGFFANLFLSLFVFFCLFLSLSVFFCLFLSFPVFFCNFVKANHIGPYPIDSNPVLWVLIRKFQECAWRCPSCTYWGSPCRTVWCWDALAWFHRHVMSCSLAWAFSSPLGSWWQLHVLWLLLSIGY